MIREVGVCSTMGVVTTLELLQHFVAKLGHRDLLFCDPTYLNPSQQLAQEHAVASAVPAASSKSYYTQNACRGRRPYSRHWLTLARLVHPLRDGKKD